MRRPRTSPTELINPIRLTMAVLVVVASSLALTARPAVAIPAYSLEERGTAIASPSLVFLDFRFEGFLRTRATGQPVDPSPVVVFSRCSGFVVNPDGYVVTATHCMKPPSLRTDAAAVLTDNLIRGGKLATADRSAFLGQVQQTADFTGASAGDAPKITVKAQLYSAVTDSDSAKTIAATVVDSQAAADGETTLVKLDRRGLPAVQLADAPLPANLAVVMLAFGPASDTSTNFIVNFTVRSQGATILGPYGNGTPPRSLLDRNIGPVSHGGMVADDGGNVLGMITADTTANDQSNKIVTPTSTIADLLEANQVKNTLAPMDQTYRAALDAYFGGRYTEAIKKLDSVLAAEPDNAVAQTYRQHASVRLAIEGDPSAGGNPLTLVLAIAGGVLLLALAAVVGLMVTRARRREREFMYFDPYGPPQPAQISASPWPTSSAPTSGPAAITAAPTVPISAVPASASPYAPQVSAPPGGYYYPPPPAPHPDLTPPPPPAYPVVVPVPPPTPMSVAPQYGQALPEPWGPPAAPVPVPAPQPPAPYAPGSPYPPQAPVTGAPADPQVAAEPPTGQPWDPTDEERIYGSPPDAYRNRP